MIRPLTLLCMVAAAGSGLYLYQEKQQARQLDRHIADVQAEIAATRNRSGVLRAEYTLLNDPDRLAQLAAQYVPDLKPTQPPQWTSLADLDKRLPPVGAPTVAPMPLEPNAADTKPAPAPVPQAGTTPTEAPAAPAPPPEPAVASVPVAQAPAHDAPKLAAAVPPPVRTPPKAIAVAAARPAVRPMVVASARPAPRPPARVAAHTAPTVPVVATLAPVPQPMRVSARVTAPQPDWRTSALPPAAPLYPVSSQTRFVGSALGMAHSGLAPTPVASYPAVATAPVTAVSAETLR